MVTKSSKSQREVMMVSMKNERPGEKIRALSTTMEEKLIVWEIVQLQVLGRNSDLLTFKILSS